MFQPFPPRLVRTLTAASLAGLFSAASRAQEWQDSSQWLYEALSARFQDHAGDYQGAMNSIADVAERSGEYQAFEYSYSLALDTMHLARAEQIARQWYQHYPDDNEALLALMRVLLMREETQDSAMLMQKMLIKDAGPQNIAQISRMLTYLPNDSKRLAILAQLSQDFPRNPYLYYYMGLQAKEQGQVSLAIDTFDRALKIDSNWTQLEILQAETLASIGDMRRANALLDQLLEKRPNDVTLLSTAVDIHVDHYQWEEALALAERWLALQTDVRIRQLMAWLKANAGHYGDALIAYRELLDDGVIEYDEYLFQIAQANEKAGYPLRAISLLNSVPSESRLHMRARQQIALIAFRMGNIALAQQYFSLLRHQFPDYRLELYLVEAAQLDKHGAWRQGGMVLDEALRAFPDQVDVLYAFAEHQGAQGNIALAETVYRKILSLDPANIDTLNAYGYLLLTHTDRRNEAARMIGEAINAYPDSPAIQDSYGWLLYQQGNLDEALVWLRRAYAAYRRGDIASHYIEVLHASGNHQLASEVYHMERKGQPDNENLHKLGKRLKL